ncbi:MAG: aryl-sulfate sulfotransferase [Candidatus Electrothrix sp. GW3-4]|uniref:aryl-sulfate sulfotransferase n=1 Tax=Candidatus Electrothrix sp. GW3-4 TaxID=3126740 RepID=UPI0030D33DA4
MRYTIYSILAVTVLMSSTAGTQQVLSATTVKSSIPATATTATTGSVGFLPAVFSLLLNTTVDTEIVAEGYNLFAPLSDTTTYLMDNDGNTVHTWASSYTPGHAVYLLENGQLLHTGKADNTTFEGGGAGGIVETIDWDGTVTWEYSYSSSEHLQHHDTVMLPSGNFLLIAWQYKTRTEALDAGRNPSLLTEAKLWPDSVIEVEPTGVTTGNIVWEWHVWDHLIQDYDATKDNYGTVADHPELVDLNYVQNGTADWTHINAIKYSEDFDQILVSVRNLSEIWVIDHSTTTAEAAGHSGGNSGKGGDLLYRWGNPAVYGAGDSTDQQLFVQHDAEWIEAGSPGEGNILIFNNGTGRSDGDYSSIVEIEPPVDASGNYTLASGESYGPSAPTWTYTAATPTDFYANRISGQQRQSNGNTLICNGPDGYFFEVNSNGETVWEYDYGNRVFRVERYPFAYSGFDGTDLDDE